MKIAILGKLETKYYAPFGDNSWEIWSMNKHIDEDLIPRVDKWFDLHITPIKKNADITISNFPFNEIHEMVGGRYFVSTSAYLIAYAVLLGATDISLYGMRFEFDGNPRRQRELENVRQMIFFAKGRGVNVTIPEDLSYILPEHITDDSEDFDQ